MERLEICVVGLGYIGLPTASLLATRGHQVLGIDVSKAVVDTINHGDIHIVEPTHSRLLLLSAMCAMGCYQYSWQEECCTH